MIIGEHGISEHIKYISMISERVACLSVWLTLFPQESRREWSSTTSCAWTIAGGYRGTCGKNICSFSCQNITNVCPGKGKDCFWQSAAQWGIEFAQQSKHGRQGRGNFFHFKPYSTHANSVMVPHYCKGVHSDISGSVRWVGRWVLGQGLNTG